MTDDTKALLQRLRHYGDNDRDAAALLIERQAAQIRSLKTLLDGADARNVRDGASIFKLQEQAADVQGERAANAILTAEVERLQGELKARHQRQHDAEALAGEYLVQRDDAREKLAEPLRLLTKMVAAMDGKKAANEAGEPGFEFNDVFWSALEPARAAIAKP